jgi:ATP-dependent RNA helicase SUPV3L1/SUV3
MLETEIGKSGEVSVEGHVIGRLDGFMFAPDASAAGSEAKALNAAAQKALAGEIEARATRLSQAPNDQIVLANDGAVRWMGDVVGKLGAGDDTLRPRVRIVADEHLTGPARDLVQTRLDLWLKTQIEKQLAPLFSLSAAEDVTGMARGVAFQLVESLGVLERQKVAEEVKGLDQPARATLRKYGVRFGAYHIYLPALLKPAPRALATQLWALKHESPDAHGVTELLHLAASGRTSIPVDKDTPKPLYRTAGYRACGERAVRVDILERLADLIRPALSWRESVTPKPEGAVDGRSFTVTGAMTSLTGASGEDFSSILRALGYRMDRRPKPAETPAAAAAAGEAQAEASEAASTETSVPADETGAQPAASSIALLPDAEFLPQADHAPASEASSEAEPSAEAAVEASAAPAPGAPEPVAAPSEPAAADETAVAPTAEASTTDGAAVETAAAPADETAATPAAPAEEPAFIEVWRPGGRSDRRPHRPRRPRPQQAAASAAPSAAAGEAAEAGEAAAASADGVAAGEPAQAPQPRPGRPDGQDRPDRQARRERNERRERAERQGQRPEREGGDRGPRRDRPRRKRDDGPDRAEREKYYAKPHGGGAERRDKQPDPNSPFAKLAALKQQLEQGGES